ncbi:MAG TPA: hypothetical protein VFZ91_08115 [Allosphingosinicella sp.]
MSRSPPLRFLVAVLGGWAAMRAALLGPAWWSVAPAATGAAAPAPARASIGPLRTPGLVAPPGPAPLRRRPVAAAFAGTPPAPATLAVDPLSAGPADRPAAGAEAAEPLPPAPPPDLAALGKAAGDRRWSLHGWALLRPGGGPGLAAGGTLGGAQAGLRAGWRLNRDPARPLALAARLSSPIGGRAAAEAALGIEWQPSRRLPLRLLAERRQRLAAGGRSAFGLTVHGGVGEAALGRLRIDAHAQAGLVGVRSRDLFGDGALRVSLPAGGRARLGAGAWAAAQPGVARLDLGPQASLRLPLAGRAVTVAADWRVRVAGNARPGSGPVLTVATDF